MNTISFFKKTIFIPALFFIVNLYADEEKQEQCKPSYTFTGNVSLVSDYRFRGISQTMRSPAIQGGFDYLHDTGIYLGTWASNIDGTSHFYNNTSMEWDFYGGYQVSIADFLCNLRLLYYYYPGGQAYNPTGTSYNTAEFSLQLAYKWFSIRYHQTITNYFGINSNNTPFNWSQNISDAPNGSSKASYYIEGNISVDLVNKYSIRSFRLGKLNLLLHAGHQKVRHYENLSYTDWSATLTQEFNWFSVFVTYVSTNAKHAYYNVFDNAFNPQVCHLGTQEGVVGITKTF